MTSQIFGGGMWVLLQDGRTALHLAALNGHHEALRKLLLYGVEIDDRDIVSLHCDVIVLA